MHVALLLDVVIGQDHAILQLPTCEDQSLLVRRDSCPACDSRLEGLHSQRRHNTNSDGLTRQGLHEDLHITKICNMQGWLILDIVVGQGALVLQMPVSEDQALLCRWNAINASLHNANRVWSLYVQGGGCPIVKGPDEDPHSTVSTVIVQAWSATDRVHTGGDVGLCAPLERGCVFYVTVVESTQRNAMLILHVVLV